MSVTPAPDEKEVKDFFFKHLVKVRVCDTPSDVPRSRMCVLAVSNKYGLTFVGIPNGFAVLKTAEVFEKAKDVDKVAAIINDLEKWTEVTFQATPTHIALSSDDLTLSVCVKEGTLTFAHMYDIRAFADKGSKPGPFLSVKLSNTDADLQDLAWNPSSDFSSMFVTCMSNGDLALWEVKDINLHIVASVSNVGASCACWSPKGKQVAIGKVDGTIVQLDHQLKIKKTIAAPQGLAAGNALKVVDLLWHSTHVFMASYLPQDPNNTEPPCLVIINIPKNEAASYVNYEDVCYGGSDERKHRYYFINIPEWDMVGVSSANALEIAVLGQVAGGGWERWNLDDSGRAEMPLTEDYQETYPMGIALDLTSQQPVQISETVTHPASPVFMALSTDGVLLLFHMINKRENARQLTSPCQQLSKSEERKPAGAAQPAPAAPTTTSQPSTFTGLFGGAKPPGETVVAKPPSSVFNFGGQSPAPPISFAKPASQMTANQSSAFSFGAATSGKPVSIFGQKSTAFGAMDLVKESKPAVSQPISFSANAPTTSVSSPTATFAAPAPNQTAIKPASSGNTSSMSVAPGFAFKPPAAQPNVATVKPTLSQQTPTPATLAMPAVTPPSVNVIKEAAPPIDNIAKKPETPVARFAKPSATSTPARSPTKRSVDGSVENPFLKSILDEMRDFQSELNEMRQRAAGLRVDIGTKEEMTTLRENTAQVAVFSSDIKQTMQSLNEDIHSLKSDSLEGFALMEECKARQQRKQDPRYKQLLASRALDPLSEKRMKTIRTQIQYLDTSVRDVSARLDTQWEHYLNHRNNQRRKMQVPLSDTVYQTIKNNHVMMSNQSKLLEQISAELQQLKVGTGTPSWQSPASLSSTPRYGSISNSPLDNSSMFSTTGGEKASPLTPQLPTGSPRGSPMSPEKTSRLRDMLSRRRVTPVKCTAPGNLSMSKIAAAESLRHSLSEDVSRDLAVQEGATPTRPATAGARQILATSTPTTSAPLSFASPASSAPAIPRLAEGFQRIPEGSSSAGPKVSIFGGQKAQAGPPNGVSAPRPPSYTAPMGAPVANAGFGGNLPAAMSASGSEKSVVQPAAVKPTIFGQPKPPVPQTLRDIQNQSILSMTLRPATTAPVPMVIPTTTVAIPTSSTPAFSFGASKPVGGGFTFGPAAGAAAPPVIKPPDKPTAPPGSYKPVVEDITPPGTPPVEREDPEGFQQDDEHRPTIVQKPVKQDPAGSILKSLLTGSTSQSAAVPLTTAPLTGHPSRSLFTVGAESSSTPQLAPPATTTTTHIKNLFGTASAQPGARGGGDTGSATFMIGDKQVEGSDSESTSSSPNQLDDAPESQNAGGSETESSNKVVTTTTGAATGFSFSLASSTKSAPTTAPGFSFQPSGQASVFGGSNQSTSSAPALFGGTSSVFAGTAGSGAGSIFTKPTVTVAATTTNVITAVTTASATTAAATTAATASATSTGVKTADTPPSDATKAVTTVAAITSATTTTASGFVFATSATTNAAATSVFTKPAGSVFGGTKTSTTSVFGGTTTTTTSVFGGPSTTTTSVFGGTSTATTSVFGGPSTATTSVFGGTQPSTATAAPAFGAPNTSEVSIFGGSTGQVTPAFGSVTVGATTSAPATTTPSIFGKPATTAAPASIFGGSTATTAAPASIFGGSTATTTSFSVFGTQSGSVFGSTATSGTATSGAFSTQGQSVFGGGQASTHPAFGTTSTFGQSAPTSSAGFGFVPSGSGSVFGGGQPESASGGLFGQAATTSASGGGIFGQTSTTSSSGLFGQTPTTSSSGLFGQTPTTSSGGLFGQTTSSGSSVFGQANSSGGVFGQATTSSSVFGQSTTSTGAFSQQSTGFGQTSTGGAFGQSTASSSSGSVFGGGSGGFFSGLGGKPSQENANKNVFGGSITVGSSGTNTGLFGQSGNQGFGQGSTFGSGGGGGFSSSGAGTFSAGGGSIASAGFGGFQTPQKQTGGFGAAPSFGGGATFGASPTFGGGAVFGSSPTFGGAPQAGTASVFGGGASGSQSSGFASFASAQAPTFGALASVGSPGFGGGGAGTPTGFGAVPQGGSVFGGSNNTPNQGFGSAPSFGGGSPAFSAYRS